jgi:hypothetical protein
MWVMTLASEFDDLATTYLPGRVRYVYVPGVALFKLDTHYENSRNTYRHPFPH